MHLNLGQEFEEFIQEQVRSGYYGNATEVIRAALRRMREEELKLAALRASLQVGENQIAQGEVVRYRPELLETLAAEAAANARKGKAIKDDVKPA